jgi:hypothetical protein
LRSAPSVAHPRLHQAVDGLRLPPVTLTPCPDRLYFTESNRIR